MGRETEVKCTIACSCASDLCSQGECSRCGWEEAERYRRLEMLRNGELSERDGLACLVIRKPTKAEEIAKKLRGLSPRALENIEKYVDQYRR